MKNNRGVTLISLAVSIVVIGILAGVTIKYGGNLVTRASLQNINTNMLLIQAKTRAIEENAKFNNDSSKYVGIKVSDISEYEMISELIGLGVINTTENWRLLQKTQLETMGLGKINVEKGYIVNYDTEEIVYAKGFKYNGTTYYKLSEMKALKIE